MRKILPPFRSRLAAASLQFGRLALPVLVISALVHRADIVTTPQFLVLLTLGLLLGALACGSALAAGLVLWQRGGHGWAKAVRGFVYGLIALSPAFVALYAFAIYPRLADISTDTANPPQLASGRPFTNGESQAEAYPDLVSRRFRIPPADLHQAALQVAMRSRWTVTAELPPGMPDEPTRFQAVATSLVFAFRDDIALRILPDPVGAKLDIRSASRFGAHDLGANANRIRSFFEDLDAVLVAAYGTLEPVEEDEELPGDLPLLDPNAPQRENSPPPLPGAKPESQEPGGADTVTSEETAPLEQLPDDLSEIYEEDRRDPPPDR